MCLRIIFIYCVIFILKGIRWRGDGFIYMLKRGEGDIRYGMENVGTSPAQTLGFNLHNTILQSWLAGGILTCLGAVWLYATVLAVGWRFVRRDDPLASALFAACVAFVMMDMVHPHLYMRFKWFSAALLLATLNKTSRSSRLKEADPRDAVN